VGRTQITAFFTTLFTRLQAIATDATTT